MRTRNIVWRRETQERRLTNSYINSLYKELSKHYSQTSDATHYDKFRCEAKRLYFRSRDKPLTNEDGKLRTIGKLKALLGIQRLKDLGFDIPSGKLTPQQSLLNRAEEVMSSMSDVANANDIEPQRNYRECIKKHVESHRAIRRRIPAGFTNE